MNDFINNELEFKNTHIEDINSMISQFSANQELNLLMEQQRTYSVLVRELTEEMRKNELLSND